MVLWELILISIGVGVLLGVSLWPVILIAVGGAMLLSPVWGRRYRGWSWWNCWGSPYSWQELHEVRNRRRSGEGEASQ